MKKRILSLILALTMLCAFVPCVHAVAIIDSGTCGDNLTWTFDSNGTLTISGTGDMDDYRFYENYYKTYTTLEGYSSFIVPWHDYSESIRNVSISDKVTSIGSWAFPYCTDLTYIEIPDSVTSIGDSALSFCGCLSINVDENNSYYSDIDGVLFNKAATEIISYAKDEIASSYALPNSVTSIGDCAFEGCFSLTNVEIPDSVTNIGDFAFFDCSSLTKVNIPDGVTSIGCAAFKDCTELISVEIPDSVTSIGDYAFSVCSSLTSAKIPSGVTSISDNVFFLCSSLTSVELPTGVTSIGDYAFESCSSLTSIKIPNGVTNIGECVFKEWININKVDRQTRVGIKFS